MFLVIPFLLSQVLFASSYGQVRMDDFDALAKQYAENKAREFGRELKWWDLYGKHEHLATRPQYKEYKITVWSDNINYGQVEKTLEKPGYVYTQWFHNQQSVPIVTEFLREVQLQSTYTWSMTASVKMNTEIKATVGIPDVLGASTYFNSSIDLQESKAQTKHERETYSVKNIITIPSNKSVKAEFVVTEKDVEIPWEADVEIEGWIAMWFDPKHNNHWLWFHPIVSLNNNKFRVSRDGKRLLYRTKGKFRGLRGVDTVLKTYEYDLITYRSSAKRVPTKVTIYKPNLTRVR